MRYYILTLFPDMIRTALSESIIGRAAASGEIEVHAINIRDFSADKHKKVDDYPYGGGAGMVMQAQPVYDAYLYAKELAGEKAPCIYLGPQGKTFSQKKAHELAKEDAMILLCGHYEGVDERVLEEIATDYISVGDYILTGGELAAMIVCDATARLIPGVLHNETSAV
ncbi:MAG: tRNA (guanosine(37)-N1)-methyltransferase TrmD, partial [Lachnospiraceae bacterium]|nr:tRNA (guanosine(37)-N1)-methyltransferase TrmD [Lachnospiraceae bacterium]